jgi:hypothetical protein
MLCLVITYCLALPRLPPMPLLYERGSLSFFLGGKAPSDPVKWAPNISAVKAMVKYALSTERLKLDPLNRPEADIVSCRLE